MRNLLYNTKTYSDTRFPSRCVLVSNVFAECNSKVIPSKYDPTLLWCLPLCSPHDNCKTKPNEGNYNLEQSRSRLASPPQEGTVTSLNRLTAAISWVQCNLVDWSFEYIPFSFNEDTWSRRDIAHRVGLVAKSPPFILDVGTTLGHLPDRCFSASSVWEFLARFSFIFFCTFFNRRCTVLQRTVSPERGPFTDR